VTQEQNKIENRHTQTAERKRGRERRNGKRDRPVDSQKRGSPIESTDIHNRHRAGKERQR